jgi:phosphoglycolate phosphatase-like HAD superfamily hydrolase
VQPIRAAIFDLDGTLVDSLPATVDAFNVVVSPFLGTRLTAKEVRIVGVNYRKVLGNFLPADKVDAGLEKLLAEFLAKVGDVRPFAAVPALLADLKRRGCKLAVATLRAEEITQQILESSGLASSFERVLCGAEAQGSSQGLAVDPAALAGVAAELGVPVEHAAFVCDSTVDVEAGRKAGMRTAAVSWGYQRREDLALSGPDFMFDPIGP